MRDERGYGRAAAAAVTFVTTTLFLASTSVHARQTPSPPADPEARLAALGIKLPAPSAPVANYVKAVRTGNLIFLAGHGPQKESGDFLSGKVGKELTVPQGYDAARLTAIGLLGTLKAEIGNLSKVKRIVKVLGLVNCGEGFTDHPKVINGASDLFVEVFGDRGRHARSAIGAVSLPLNIPVEIEMIVEVEGS